jgi:hypothetical protein
MLHLLYKVKKYSNILPISLTVYAICLTPLPFEFVSPGLAFLLLNLSCSLLSNDLFLSTGKSEAQGIKRIGRNLKGPIL